MQKDTILIYNLKKYRITFKVQRFIDTTTV